MRRNALFYRAMMLVSVPVQLCHVRYTSESVCARVDRMSSRTVFCILRDMPRSLVTVDRWQWKKHSHSHTQAAHIRRICRIHVERKRSKEDDECLAGGWHEFDIFLGCFIYGITTQHTNTHTHTCARHTVFVQHTKHTYKHRLRCEWSDRQFLLSWLRSFASVCVLLYCRMRANENSHSKHMRVAVCCFTGRISIAISSLIQTHNSQPSVYTPQQRIFKIVVYRTRRTSHWCVVFFPSTLQFLSFVICRLWPVV